MNCGDCIRFKSFEAENAWLGHCNYVDKNVSMPDQACEGYISKELLHFYTYFFVNRADTYGIQTEKGPYSRIETMLTIDILKDHFRGEHTVGLYQLDKDNQVKWLCFDLDPEHIEDPKNVALKIVAACLENNRFYESAVWLEASRYPDPSFHVWVLFTPKIEARVAKWLGQQILGFAGVNPKSVELFPKQAELTESRPYGNLVKAPLGLHQNAQKWSCFLEHSSMQPIPSNSILTAWGCNLSEKDLTRINTKANKERGLQTRIAIDLPTDYEALETEEEKRTVKVLVKYWREGYRNQLTMSFLGWAIKHGINFESAYRILDQVTRIAKDEERESRLELAKYHYQQRKELGSELKGITGLEEIISQLVKAG